MPPVPPQTGSPLLHGTLRRCERLLAMELPVADVARKMRVGRKAVALIRDRIHPQQYSTEIARCALCGGMVKLPCMRCGQMGEVA